MVVVVVVVVCERARERERESGDRSVSGRRDHNHGCHCTRVVTVQYSERTWLPITSALGFNVRTDDIVGVWKRFKLLEDEQDGQSNTIRDIYERCSACPSVFDASVIRRPVGVGDKKEIDRSGRTVARAMRLDGEPAADPGMLVGRGALEPEPRAREHLGRAPGRRRGDGEPLAGERGVQEVVVVVVVVVRCRGWRGGQAPGRADLCPPRQQHLCVVRADDVSEPEAWPIEARAPLLSSSSPRPSAPPGALK